MLFLVVSNCKQSVPQITNKRILFGDLVIFFLLIFLFKYNTECIGLDFIMVV